MAKSKSTDMVIRQHNKHVDYSKWGYIFLIPFFLVYVVFSLVPLVSTFVNSFFENYRILGLKQVGPNFIGLDNYFGESGILTNGELWQYAKNTMIMWVMGFVPQIVFAMLLAVWFTSSRLKIKCQPFFKSVIYMPNLIMASAMAALFFALFTPSGPVNQICLSLGILENPYDFLAHPWSARTLVALMNFLMWFGNTTILLMAGIMGIDMSLFEAARVDGASPMQVFRKITMPLLTPVFVYVLITSMIGGIQMFDVPQILTNGGDSPKRACLTVIMFLNNHLHSKNYGVAGAISVIIFICTSILGIAVYQSMMSKYRSDKPRKSKKRGDK